MKNESKLSHSMVHYLLTIHNLKENRGFARITDIAKELKLTKGSVSIAVNNLKKKGLVETEADCKFLKLSTKGHDEVHKILSGRTLLFSFLRDFLGVSEEVARIDSCLMEHLMSTETRSKFFSFMKNCQGSHPDTQQNNSSTEAFKFEKFRDFDEFMNVF